MKFIAYTHALPYIKQLSDYLDIEFSDNFDVLSHSDRAFLVWHPYKYLYKNPSYETDLALFNVYKARKSSLYPSYVLERGALPDTLFMDKRGFLFESDSYRPEYWHIPLKDSEKAKIKAYIEDFKVNDHSLETQQKRVTKEGLKQFLVINNNNPTVFVPLQRRDDTVSILWSHYAKDLDTFIATVLEVARQRPNVNFLIKNHPWEVSKLLWGDPRLIDLPNVKIADNVHYKDCLDYCNQVLTIHSGVGLQAMMWEKPLMYMGDCFYGYSDHNEQVTGVDDILEFIKNPKPVNRETMYMFMYYLKYKFYSEGTIFFNHFVKYDTLRFTTPKGRDIIELEIENKSRVKKVRMI